MIHTHTHTQRRISSSIWSGKRSPPQKSSSDILLKCRNVTMKRRLIHTHTHYLCMYVCMYVCIYVHTYTHKHTISLSLSLSLTHTPQRALEYHNIIYIYIYIYYLQGSCYRCGPSGWWISRRAHGCGVWC